MNTIKYIEIRLDEHVMRVYPPVNIESVEVWRSQLMDEILKAGDLC